MVALQLVDRHFQVQLAHAAEDELARLRIGAAAQVGSSRTILPRASANLVSSTFLAGVKAWAMTGSGNQAVIPLVIRFKSGFRIPFPVSPASRTDGERGKTDIKTDKKTNFKVRDLPR